MNKIQNTVDTKKKNHKKRSIQTDRNRVYTDRVLVEYHLLPLWIYWFCTSRTRVTGPAGSALKTETLSRSLGSKICTFRSRNIRQSRWFLIKHISKRLSSSNSYINNVHQPLLLLCKHCVCHIGVENKIRSEKCFFFNINPKWKSYCYYSFILVDSIFNDVFIFLNTYLIRTNIRSLEPLSNKT